MIFFVYSRRANLIPGDSDVTSYLRLIYDQTNFLWILDGEGTFAKFEPHESLENYLSKSKKSKQN